MITGPKLEKISAQANANTGARLLAAAISGLLCMPGCGSDGGEKARDQGTAGDGDGKIDASGNGDRDADVGDQSPSDAGDGQGDGDAPGEQKPTVTLERHDPDMTREKFEELCDQANGKLEVHPHCGGANSCKGFSYDSDVKVYSEHTCKGLNTCTGYSCVVPDVEAGASAREQEKA